MQIRDLIPWGRGKREMSHRSGYDDHPLLSLQREMNRVFDEFWSRFDQPFGGTGGFLTAGGPKTDVVETDGGIEVAVELPGIDEKDIEVSLTGDALTVRGEKKANREEKLGGYYLAERSYGAFHRTIPLPPGVDTDKAKAEFRKGVLTITLPRIPEAQARVRRIDVEVA